MGEMNVVALTPRAGRSLNRMTSQHNEVIRTGTIVEVWNRSLGRFGGTFEVAEATPAGIRVRRPADSAALPSVFTPDEVRRLDAGRPERPR